MTDEAPARGGTGPGARRGRRTADPDLRALSAACPAVRRASGEDEVAGAVPRFVATPSSLPEASALLRAASDRDLAVVPRGTATKLGWGTPPRRCDLVVDTLGLDQVVEHAAGDLVARVQAGVRLDRLAGLLAGTGQQLALDAPPLPGGPGPAGTVGGVLATGAAGPRRLRYGAPRDLVIGLTVVRADGTLARSGGKVVKNVAGYDLGKLFAGSYGTLGLIVEAVMRLHPVPPAAAYTVTDCADAAEAHRVVAAAAGSDLAPAAIEVDRPGRDHPVRVGVLVEGDPAGVAERSALASALLGADAGTAPGAPAWWGRADGTGTLIKVAFWAGALTGVFEAVDECGLEAGLDPAVAGSAAAGVLHVTVGVDADPAATAGFVSALRPALARAGAAARPAAARPADLPPVLATAQVLRAPAPVRERVDMWGQVPALALMRAVKDQFDPAYLMAPGRFAGGI